MKALILVWTLACGTLFAQDVREYSGPVSFHEDQEGVTALVDGVRVAVRSKGFSQRALSFWEAAPVRGSLTFVDTVPSALDVSALEAVLTKEISVLVAGTIRLISPGTRVLIVAQKQWGVLELQPLDCGLPADVRAHASKASLRLAATHAGRARPLDMLCGVRTRGRRSTGRPPSGSSARADVHWTRFVAFCLQPAVAEHLTAQGTPRRPRFRSETLTQPSRGTSRSAQGF